MDKERPQLSCALRAISSITPDLLNNNNTQFNSNQSLLADKLKKQRLLLIDEDHTNLSWDMLTSRLSQNCHKHDMSKVTSTITVLIMNN